MQNYLTFRTVNGQVFTRFNHRASSIFSQLTFLLFSLLKLQPVKLTGARPRYIFHKLQLVSSPVGLGSISGKVNIIEKSYSALVSALTSSSA